MMGEREAATPGLPPAAPAEWLRLDVRAVAVGALLGAGVAVSAGVPTAAGVASGTSWVVALAWVVPCGLLFIVGGAGLE